MGSFDYSEEFLEHISEIFKAFGNVTRLKIFQALHNTDEDGLSVNELNEEVGTSQANISKHLNVMEDQGLLDVRSDGTTRIYYIADERVTEICERVCDYMEQRLDDLASMSGS
jgi:DNA-binding transcriptional ArsR family regulator